MTTEDFKRKLVTILHANVKGYSRLIGEDEDATVSTLNAYREVMGVLIQKHRGQVMLRHLGLRRSKNGLARVRCEHCGHKYLLAFSCKRRHFCPDRKNPWSTWLATSFVLRSYRSE
jgi:class 3 adenylate cyclase